MFLGEKSINPNLVLTSFIDCVLVHQTDPSLLDLSSPGLRTLGTNYILFCHLWKIADTRKVIFENEWNEPEIMSMEGEIKK